MKHVPLGGKKKKKKKKKKIELKIRFQKLQYA